MLSFTLTGASSFALIGHYLPVVLSQFSSKILVAFFGEINEDFEFSSLELFKFSEFSSLELFKNYVFTLYVTPGLSKK